MAFNPSQQIISADQAKNGAFSWLKGLMNDVTGRSAQQSILNQQQEFDEYMYTQYNSPEALKRQFEDAGINTNLLGSTSFGTAQSAAGAPAVNGNATPLASVAGAASDIGAAMSQMADPALKAAQTQSFISQDDLNKGLVDKYGKDAMLTDIQYQTAKQTLDWMRNDRECTAMTMRVAYFQACQNLRNSKQEFENMLKEGKLLDSQQSREEWEAKIKEETFNFLVEHHYLPDADYLDRIYTDYIYNGDSQGFNRFMNGQTMLFDRQNASDARYGANGGNLKIGPVSLDAPMLRFIFENSLDLGDVVDDYRNNTDKTGFWSRFGKGNSENSVEPIPEKEHDVDKIVNICFDYMDKSIRSSNHKPTGNEIRKMLVSKGYSSKWLADHWKEILHAIDYD